MTDQPSQSTPQIATANVKQKTRRFSPVWVIPVLALLIGGWMVFKSALNENTKIVVTFKDAAGIQAGKTEVKLRDIVVGKVEAVDFAKDLGQISVTLQFPKIPASRFTDKTRFWIVKPRVGLGGVSGLETLLSGAYVEVDPGELDGGKVEKNFIGLEHPEIYQLGNPGTYFKLRSETLGSLSRESPVKYRDVEVGQVTRYALASDNTSVDIDIFIRAPFDKLVKKDSRFWNISGLRFAVSAEGVKMMMDSVTTLVAGGIAFSTNDLSTGAQASAGSEFTLYRNEKADPADVAELLVFNVPFKLYFEEGVNGLQEGAPAEFKGLRIGTVASISVEFDTARENLRTYAIVKIEPGRLPADSVDNDLPDAERTRNVHRFFETMAARGMRAQLKSGNLLTGQSLVVFDMFADASPAPVEYVAGMAVFPTMPESLSNIMAKIDRTVARVDAILAKVDALPIARIGNDLAQTMASINAIPMKEIGDNLAAATGKMDALPYERISKNLDETLANLDALIGSLNASQGGALGVQTLQALSEISKAADALRGMAEYLERHPEALLRGKKAP